MATVRKRKRKNKDGSETVRYLVRWQDPPIDGGPGPRRSKKFKLRGPADSFKAKVEWRLEMGLTGEEQESETAAEPTVFDACQAWLNHVEDLVKSGKREPTTWTQYDQHVRLHIAPHPIAKTAITKLDAPSCQEFAWHLERTKHPKMAEKIFKSFKAALSHTVATGKLAINPAAEIAVDTTSRALLSEEEAEAQERAVIPELHEVRAYMDAAREMDDKGRALAFLSLCTFPGLRVSEVRGLGLPHLHLFGDEAKVKVRRRAAQNGKLGPPKTKHSYRTIVLGADTVAAIRKWLESVTASADALVFATEGGKPIMYSHLYRHLLVPVMVKVTEKPGGPCLVSLHFKPDDDGKPTVRNGGHFAGPYCPLVIRPKYTFHEMRHVAASLWIKYGGANPKQIQEWMGHSSIKVTMDIYGHLWEDTEQSAAMARAAELTVMNAVRK